MQRIIFQMLLLTFILAQILGNVLPLSAQGTQKMADQANSSKLPPKFLSLVPQGYAIETENFFNQGSMASVSFGAKKHYEGQHSIRFSAYYFDLLIQEYPNQLIKMYGPAYKIQLEKDIESAMNSRLKDKSGVSRDYEKPLLKKYAWGAGITQKITHKYMGAGTNPDEVEYSCVFFGLIVNEISIHKFSTRVSGVKTQAEAEQWAQKVAEKISKASLANMNEK